MRKVGTFRTIHLTPPSKYLDIVQTQHSKINVLIFNLILENNIIGFPRILGLVIKFRLSH